MDSNDNYTVVSIHGHNDHPVRIRRTDHLREINAELLAALRKIETVSHHKRAWEIASAAIARAEGEDR